VLAETNLGVRQITAFCVPSHCWNKVTSLRLRLDLALAHCRRASLPSGYAAQNSQSVNQSVLQLGAVATEE
jgi:hypothetical protein